MKTPNLQNSLSPLRENQFTTQNSFEFSLWASIVPREYDTLCNTVVGLSCVLERATDFIYYFVSFYPF